MSTIPTLVLINLQNKKNLITVLSPKTNKELLNLNISRENSLSNSVVNTNESFNANVDNNNYNYIGNNSLSNINNKSVQLINSKRRIKSSNISSNNVNIINGINKQRINVNKGNISNKKHNKSANASNLDISSSNVSSNIYFSNDISKDEDDNDFNFIAEDEDPRDLQNELEYMYEYSKNNSLIRDKTEIKYAANKLNKSNLKSPMILDYKNNSKLILHNNDISSNKSLSNYTSPKYGKLIDSLKSQFAEITHSRRSSINKNSVINNEQQNNNFINYYSSMNTSPSYTNMNRLDDFEKFDLNKLDIKIGGSSNKEEISNMVGTNVENNSFIKQEKDNKDNNSNYRKIRINKRNNIDNSVNFSDDVVFDNKILSNEQRLMTDANEYEKTQKNNTNKKIISSISCNNYKIINKSCPNKIVNTSAISIENTPVCTDTNKLITTDDISDNVFFQDKRYKELLERLENSDKNNRFLSSQNKELEMTLQIMKNYISIQKVL